MSSKKVVPSTMAKRTDLATMKETRITTKGRIQFILCALYRQERL